ncbi:hypothetical protein GIB67_036486 [Kingdonia uniflora]|uniref:CRAL-TRIO domain-containing protein n=1 Tax=Kingdonia uniflora TaxID=39325 RepID=A0A7J7P7I2_9MAGN|nr:hypothetical protein GIB67_036486 [Kingdonia uniflora]
MVEWKSFSPHKSQDDKWSESVSKLSSSLLKLSFKLAMTYSLKFGELMKRTGRSKSLKEYLEGSHDSKDEEIVDSFHRMLLLEGHLLGKHDDYYTLLRFLRMRAFDQQKAKDKYLKMLKWREDYKVDVLVKEYKYVEYREVQRCYPHGFHGVDRHGRPLYIERIGMVDLNALLQVTTIDRFVKYHIAEQEKTLNLRFTSCSVAANKHVASTTSILDVKGVGMNSFSKPARELFMEIQKIDSNYYPETLHRLFIVNAGSGFRILWKALTAFMDARTIAKIQLLGSNYQSSLAEVIDESNLPSFLGGSCTCSEFGGCLLNDKGPWNDPEITEMVQANLQSSSAHKTSAKKHDGGSERYKETRHANQAVYEKVQALETGLQDTKMILVGLLTKQEELMRQLEELKDLTLVRSLSDKKVNITN